MPDIRIILAMRVYCESISNSPAQLKAFLDNPGGNTVALSRADTDGLCSVAIPEHFLWRRAVEPELRLEKCLVLAANFGYKGDKDATR
jgi:hypothetical protein